MNKKTLLLMGSGLISFLLILVAIFGTYRLCFDNESCAILLHLSFLHLLIFFAVFIFSLITYFLPEKVFTAWFKFACVATPLSIIAIYFAPEYSNSIIYSIDKGFAASRLFGLFSLISIIIILTKLYTTREK